MPFELPPLPYDASALDPFISEKTLTFHHGKHHKGYVDKLNNLIRDTDLEGTDLETVIRSARDRPNVALFNNAAQTWNHDFFWKSMTPESSKPTGNLETALDRAFGGLSGFQKAFKEAATGQFGSGWAWLIAGANGLEIMTTHDADLPLAHGVDALMCCDVWEHAYYLDYQNERGKFVDAFLENLVNWDFVSRNWESLKKAA